MTSTPLTLPQRTGEEARARRLLGRGVSLAFTHSEGTGRLELAPLRGSALPSSEMTTWRCRHGTFALSNATQLLSLVSACPVALPETEESSAEWFWALYNDCLADEVKKTVGNIEPIADVESSLHDSLQVEVAVHYQDSTAHGVLTISSRTLLALLGQHQWRAHNLVLSDDFTCELPLVLGHLMLSLGTLNDMQVGDVLMPQEAFFDPEGRGTVSLLDNTVPVIVDVAAGQLMVTYHGGIEDDE